MATCQVHDCESAAVRTVLWSGDDASDARPVALCEEHAEQALADGRLDNVIIEHDTELGEGESDAFGYRGARSFAVEGVQVAEGKEPDTLMPVVLVTLRIAGMPQRLTFAVQPDLADRVALELQRWAKRAREKHFE